VADQFYQFAFNFTSPTVATSYKTRGGSSWTPYQEPNFTHGQLRVGGPNNPNNPNGPSGNYLVANAGDSVFINVTGPAGWTVPAGSAVQVIVSQANSPGTNQGNTPFASNYVYYQLTAGALQPDGVTMQYQIPSTIQASANPGRGNYNRYELTVAFSVADPSGNVYYFADDPEMDVQGS
jgi:hypothetical protein